MTSRVPFARLASLAFFAALLLALGVYPLEGHWFGPLLLGYLILLWWRPALWLFCLPVLLPAVDLAPRTGWFFLAEMDLFLMVTAGFCYWHLYRPVARSPRWPASFRAALWLLAGACAIGLWRGLRADAPLDANAFNNYLSPYNALPVAKGWLWALVLLPPLRQAAGGRLEGLKNLFVPGMLAGLALVAGAAIAERLRFPGLLNFSSDYRISAPFSAMHTGGAALDGYLALTFPLLAMWLFGRRSPARTTAALLLLPLALYAGLATFSRGLYLGYAVAVVTLAWAAICGAMRRVGGEAAGARGRWVAAMALSLAASLVVIATLNAVFVSSGYRGYGAALLLLSAMLLLAAQPLRPAMLGSGLASGLALCGLLAWLLPVGNPPHALLKPPYLLFICSALGFGAAMFPGMPVGRRHGPVAQAPAALAYAGLLLSAAWIAVHTAGPSALRPSAGLLALALLPLALNLAWRQPLWIITPRKLTALIASLLVLASVVPVYNGYFVGQRFGATTADLSQRLRHWRQSLAMMDDDPATKLLGMGFGTFPATYYWRNPTREVPPSYRYVDRSGDRALRLATGEHPAGYGEPLRMWQALEIRPATPYLLEFDVWNDGPPAFLQVELCERQLLYRRHCVAVPPRRWSAEPYWQHVSYGVNAGTLGATGAPVRLELSALGQRAALEVDNISLRAAIDRHDIVRNGDFSAANNYWFFSSDHHHLPWHIKNLWLNIYFELGWPGLLAYGALVSSAFVTLWRRARHGHDGGIAAAWLAAMLAFQMVGLFDSLVDVPRITLLFILVLCAAALRPAPPTSDGAGQP